jgi:hypothetical protein
VVRCRVRDDGRPAVRARRAVTEVRGGTWPTGRRCGVDLSKLSRADRIIAGLVLLAGEIPPEVWSAPSSITYAAVAVLVVGLLGERKEVSESAPVEPTEKAPRRASRRRRSVAPVDPANSDAAAEAVEACVRANIDPQLVAQGIARSKARK